jgi:hypothetical protein
VACAGALAVCKGHAGHGGLGGVLEGCCFGCGGLWVGSGAVMAVGIVQEEERQIGGSWAHSSPSLHFSRLGSGQRELGSTAGVSTSMATGTRRTGAVIFTVKSIFLDFCSPGVRSNARKKLKFEFLKFLTLGGQHNRQGFQRYFCSEEITCFAKICI